MDGSNFLTAPTLDEQVQHQEELRHLHQALCSLEREYQLLLYFRYWKDMSQEDVAKMLSLTQQAVSYRERYALQRLKDFCAKQRKEKILEKSFVNSITYCLYIMRGSHLPPLDL